MVSAAASGEPVIRRAVDADVPALAAFAERTFRDTFEADNRPEDMDAYCRSAFTVETCRAHVADPAIDTLVVEASTGTLIAYAQLRGGAPPQIHGQLPLELWRFYVDRGQHGHGLASRLMSAVIDAARARGAGTLWLGVWEHNHRARAFYGKAGFADVGSHTFVLGGDVQTDRLMARDLAS